MQLNSWTMKKKDKVVEFISITRIYIVQEFALDIYMNIESEFACSKRYKYIYYGMHAELKSAIYVYEICMLKKGCVNIYYT